ncbi:hypothetical protein PVS_39 [Vibrio phage vB_VspS_VS-ABTNL-3]|nr:hypothetical protein PVS_39 [Vibrio phage vB_VspS_VS-ABTNL-3]
MSIDINELLNEQDKNKPEQGDLLEQKFSPEKAELSRKTLVDMRRRIAAGDAIPTDELKDALMLIREMYGREAIAAAAKKKPAAKKKAAAKKAPKIDPQALLDDILGGI